ncbi:hypothetical protein ACWASW_001796 [Escherichia coli]
MAKTITNGFCHDMRLTLLLAAWFSHYDWHGLTSTPDDATNWLA